MKYRCRVCDMGFTEGNPPLVQHTVCEVCGQPFWHCRPNSNKNRVRCGVKPGKAMLLVPIHEAIEARKQGKTNAG